MKNLKHVMNTLPTERRAKIEVRAEELIAEEMTLRDLRKARDLAPALAATSIVVICSYAVAANQERIAQMGVWVLVMVILLNGLGYLAGWWLGYLYRFDQRHRLTLSIEIGMQNAGLGVALALEHFQPATALPGALPNSPTRPPVRRSRLPRTAWRARPSMDEGAYCPRSNGPARSLRSTRVPSGSSKTTKRFCTG